ncbi:GTPase Era involved in 16S rRNA processing/predicted transcriptional regulator [Saccharopolyspora lacisalsi]|uniref:GTPase Era involved in 16S rRNA processing/predicted transcriptional regulator n=1 Tax=Halosaccharopolyspora lacisalsi TaxID=1000566 RepID=A0A839E6A9_9PSEU|nr:dynamin family protein [Halosaccharopolyspora lacisalsi]MBA8827405.1 GTPase Era involved in 16S rRNA processing/predicted transcriptional regulator [Halosaccharopolyspora lacisalsi]
MIETALVELIDRAAAECAEQHRFDLGNRLRQIRGRVLDPAQLVLVVGESQQGKSELVNSVVNAPVCNAGEDITTVVPTIVRHSTEPSAQLVQQEPAQGPPALDRRPVPIERVHDEVEQAVADGLPLSRTEIGLPRAVLRDGLVLMDTPGVGSISSSLTATTQSVLTEADALLMVSDSTQELTTNELKFLKQVTDLCPNVALVQPKTDVTPRWREIVEVNRKHLVQAEISARIFPVSSKVRAQATSAKNPTLNTESGFPALLEYLRSEMANKHEQLARKLVSHNVSEVLDQLMTKLREELSNQSPRTATETLLELENAQHKADDLKRISGRWQKTLSDGIQELYSDIEYDFRERTWAILHQVDEVLSEADPDTTWDDFAEWLSSSLNDAVSETFGWLDQRRERLTEEVAEQLLPEHARALPSLAEIHPSDPLERVPEPKAPKAAGFPRKDQILTGLRGSYGGVLMFGLITSMAGLPLMNVVSISAGLLLGSKSLNEEKDSRLKRRQAEARNAAQRYIEHIVFQVNKDTRDTIRKLHQNLHQACNRLTEQGQIEISQSIQETKRAAEASAVDRDQRARDIKKKLEELTVLRKRAAMLTSNRIAA